MKGVLIKDFKMPENCAEYPCLRHDSMDGVHAYQCNVTLGIRKNIDVQPKWCPLVDYECPETTIALKDKNGNPVNIGDTVYYQEKIRGTHGKVKFGKYTDLEGRKHIGIYIDWQGND